ncbi:MAG: hypothetical protein ABSD67_15820 [Terracidiphilus sp.]|jgi:1,5-anhydro-D-fructose reductase (1,5-anhydro-D-mannitol-forming)
MIRYGLLGFGHHCVTRLIPAFPDAQQSVLAGLWRRDLQKAAADARDYSIDARLCDSGRLMRLVRD